MEKQHEENLALIRKGQGVTIGSGYYTTVKAYCEAHDLEIPERDREPEPEAKAEDDIVAFQPTRFYLETGDGEHEGRVRLVHLEEWREPAAGDFNFEGVLTFAPEGFDEQVAIRAQERAAGPLLPPNARDRLLAIKGIGEAKADEILAALKTEEAGS